MKAKLTIGILILLLFLAGALLIWQFNASSKISGKAISNEPIKIGAPLTLTGKLASYGEDIMKGADLAVNEINSKGGINGRPIKIIYEDTKTETAVAVTAVTKLVEIDKVSIIIGPAASGELLAVAPYTEKNKVILFTPITGSDEVTTAGGFVFRNRETSGLHSKRMAAYLAGRGINNIGVIFASAANAISYKKKFIETFESLDGKIVLALEYSPSQTDFKTEIEKIKGSNAQAVYISPMSGVDSGLIAKQLKESGFNGIITGALALDSPEFFKSAGTASEGALVTSSAFDASNPEIKAYSESYKVRYGKESNYVAANAYDAVYILKKAIEKCDGNEKDTECIRDYLYTVRDYPGVGGTTTFDSNGDVVKPLMIKVAKDGRFIVLN